MEVTSHSKEGFIEAAISCNSEFKPHDVQMRLPHPEGKKEVNVTGGTYNAVTESVTIHDFNGTAKVKVEFWK